MRKTMPNSDGSTNQRINKERSEVLMDARLEIMITTRKEMKVSEIIGFLVDEYLDEAIKDLKKKGSK